MHDFGRITAILELFKEVWGMVPDRQFCNLIFQITKRNGGLYEINDEEFVKRLLEYRTKLKEQNASMEELLKQI